MKNRLFFLSILITFIASNAFALGDGPKKAKYAAAIVFEGGLDSFDSPHRTPTWRAYLCLEKTQQPVSRQITFDFATLGNPYEVTLESTQTGEKLFQARMNKVVMNYTYSADLSNSDSESLTYHGVVNFRAESKDKLEKIYSAPGHDYPTNMWDTKFFNFEIKPTHLGVFTNENYASDKKLVYWKMWLQSLLVLEGKQTLIEPCELEDKPVVWQFGNQITK